MDCKSARLLIDVDRPRELADDDRKVLKDHLADCPECSAVSRAERAADERLGRAMQAVPIPDGLRNRILDRLATQDRIPLRRRIVRQLAVAAAILLVVALGWTWFNYRPSVQLDSQLARLDDVPRSPDEVQAWFLKYHGVRTAVPADFGDARLTGCSLVVFQGQKVPELQFIKGNDPVWIVILSDEQFDLSSLERFDTDSGRPWVIEWSSDRHHAYLIKSAHPFPFQGAQRPPA